MNHWKRKIHFKVIYYLFIESQFEQSIFYKGNARKMGI